ncbi:hypothetical protein N0V90_000624 [Kalmusia sp. IMI 367209]|nr:hypothetical protein N0V90_000624 [Kalmusia sp. IMI 367209]
MSWTGFGSVPPPPLPPGGDEDKDRGESDPATSEKSSKKSPQKSTSKQPTPRKSSNYGAGWHESRSSNNGSSSTQSNTSRKATIVPAKFYEDGDGRSQDTSAWAPSYRMDTLNNSRGIIVERITETPRFVRESLQAARAYAGYAGMGYIFYDGTTGDRLDELPGGQITQTGTTGSQILDAQQDATLAAERALEDAGEQVGHDEPLEESENNSDRNVDGSSSSSTGSSRST